MHQGGLVYPPPPMLVNGPPGLGYPPQALQPAAVRFHQANGGNAPLQYNPPNLDETIPYINPPPGMIDLLDFSFLALPTLLKICTFRLLGEKVQIATFGVPFREKKGYIHKYC